MYEHILCSVADSYDIQIFKQNMSTVSRYQVN
jgi:hypothetical protein